MKCLALVLCLPTPAHAFEASPAEVDAFTRADGDRNGLLSRQEFRGFVERLAAAGQPNARRIVAFRAYGLAFALTDADRDGQASPEELRAADGAHAAPAE